MIASDTHTDKTVAQISDILVNYYFYIDFVCMSDVD